MSAAKGKPNGVLGRDDILRLSDRKTEILEVPEWGGSVRIRELDAWQQSQYEQALIATEEGEDGKVRLVSRTEGARVRLAAFGIVDDDGRPLFTEEELRGRSARAIRRIAEAVKRLSDIDETVEVTAGN